MNNNAQDALRRLSTQASQPALPDFIPDFTASMNAVLGASWGPNERTYTDQELQQAAQERRNLLNVFKLAIKNLLESTIDLGEPVTDACKELNDFCVVLENVFKHGLRVRRSLFGRNREYWEFIESLEKLSPIGVNIINNVRALTGIRSAAGRGRAFVRSALMEKKLADYWRILLENKELVNTFYEPHALLRSEDLDPISGMLVGLSAIDLNLYLRGDELEKQPENIDWSMYMRVGVSSTQPSTSNTTGGGGGEEEVLSATEQLNRRLNTALDQKAYVEELKLKLESKLADSLAKLEQATAAQRAMEIQLASKSERLAGIERSLQATQAELNLTKASYKKDMDQLLADLENERGIFRASKTDINQMHDGMKHTLATETKLRESVEAELIRERQRRHADKESSTLSIASLEKEILQMQEDRAAFTTTISQLQAQIQEITHERDQKQQEINESQTLIEAVREELRETKSKLAAALKSKKEVRTLKSETETLQQQIADLKKQLDSAKEDNVKLLTEKTEKDRQLLGAIDRLDQAQRAIDIERDKRKEYEQRDAERVAEIQKLSDRIKQLEVESRDKDMSLADLADAYQRAQLKVSDLTEFREQIRGEKWVDDKSATSCALCHEKFSINKRKHHCRNCGNVFCASCSDNKMTVPASPKPVRVCDTCHMRLLQNHSAAF